MSKSLSVFIGCTEGVVMVRPGAWGVVAGTDCGVPMAWALIIIRGIGATDTVVEVVGVEVSRVRRCE